MPVIDQSRWRYVVTKLDGSGGGVLVNNTQRTYSHHLNVAKTAQVTVNVDNPLANFILGNDCLLKVYRKTRVSQTWQRLMVGDIIQADESGQGDMGLLTIVASDAMWRIQRRLIGMGIDSIGRGTGYSDGLVTSLVDNSVLVGNIISNLISVFPLGVSLGTVQNCGTSSYIGPVYAQNAGDTIQQLCNTLGGPTIEIVPAEPSGLMPNTNIGTVKVWGTYGQARPNAIFEYGVGRHNVATYDRILSKDGLCNIAYSSPQGFPSVSAHGDTMIIAQDSASQNAIGLYQDSVQSDLASTSLRQILVNEYVAIRKQARQQMTFTPTVDCPLDYGVDYTVGDVVTARAYVNAGYRFNGTVRVYGIDFSIDDNDAETPALTLIPS